MSSNQVSRQSPSRVFCCFITTLSFSVVVPTVWITSALWLRSVVDLDSFADVENTNRSLEFFVKLVSADILDGAMVAEWTVEKDTCSYPNCTEVDIFFDIQEYSNNNNQLTVQPTFKYNPTTTGIGGKEDAPSFCTKLNLSTSDNYKDSHSGRSSQSSPIYYPFDRFIAYEPDASRLIQMPDKFFLSDHRFAIVLAGHKRGGETDWNFDMNLSLQRSTLVMVYCLVITVTLWLVTLMISFIMIATVIFGFRKPNEIVVVPIGTVFAFTQLRSTMPGAPQEFVPQAIVMVGVYLFADPDDPSRRTFTWNELVRLNERAENASLHYANHFWSTSKEFVRRAGFYILTVIRRWRIPHMVEIPLV
ncbi:hypothetical protein IW262DRAFT_1299668 [Armillaria fumosa]|nr:hypothetical protein IW262DRAFT_1299668 [Armillaria fumosa]